MYDDYMLKHASPGHPERPERLSSLMARILSEGLLDKCISVSSRLATTEEILAVHTQEAYAKVKETEKAVDLVHLDADTYANCYSSEAAHRACGGLIELADRVAEGKLDNGFAFIRPPGHHANGERSSGFCLVNNVAIAVRAIQKKYNFKRILVIDWDVHHGNGTQDIFDADPSVLFMSVHCGTPGFYPGSGRPREVGQVPAKGYTVNVPFTNTGMVDQDYLSVFQWVFLPIAREYDPEFIFVSAGFDCGAGDKLGPMKVSTEGFGQMLHLIMDLCEHRKVVCALEGGYTLDVISAGAAECVHVLLGDVIPKIPEKVVPSVRNVWKDIKNTIACQDQYWKCMDEMETNEAFKEMNIYFDPTLVQ